MSFSNFGKELIVKHLKNGNETKFLRLVVSKLTLKLGKLNYMIIILQSVSILITLNAIRSAKKLNYAIFNCILKANHWNHIQHRKHIKGPERKKAISSEFSSRW